MTEAHKTYLQTGTSVSNAEESQLFGKPCFKINGKAFVCFFNDEMVFKLSGESHAEALSLDGTQFFDPSGKGRPMKEWVQVPFHYNDCWISFAQRAADYVGG